MMMLLMSVDNLFDVNFAVSKQADDGKNLENATQRDAKEMEESMNVHPMSKALIQLIRKRYQRSVFLKGMNIMSRSECK